jgi:hypothetical protein
MTTAAPCAEVSPLKSAECLTNAAMDCLFEIERQLCKLEPEGTFTALGHVWKTREALRCVLDEIAVLGERPTDCVRCAACQ